MSAAATTALATEYLMTLQAPISGGHSDAGTVDGTRVKGRIVAPTDDWLRTMPDGSFRVDARMAIVDDGAHIYVQFGGVIVIAPADFARMADGEILTVDEMHFHHRADVPDGRRSLCLAQPDPGHRQSSGAQGRRRRLRAILFAVT